MASKISPSPSSIRRVFLDWREPPLHTAAEWMAEHLSQASSARSPLVVLPTHRAGHRLKQRYSAACQTRDLPERRLQTLTAGQVPEYLFEQQKPTAPPMMSTLAWIEAFRQLDAGLREAILPGLPIDDWTRMADWVARIQALHERLGADVWSFQSVRRETAEWEDGIDHRRWAAFAELQQRYYATLNAEGFWDLQAARNVAVRQNECKTSRPVILIGLVDLNLGLKQMLRQCGAQVTSLIFCDERDREGFDDVGCLLPDYWGEYLIEIPDERIRILDSPGDQAVWCSEWLEKARQHWSWQDIVVGLPDDSLWPQLQRRTRSLGITPVFHKGDSIANSSVVKLLQAIANFLDEPSYLHLSELVRFPVVFDHVSDEIGGDDWLSTLTAFQNEALPWRVPLDRPPRFPRRLTSGRQTAEVLKALRAMLAELLPDPSRHSPQRAADAEPTRTLSEWSRAWLAVLERLYPGVGSVNRESTETESGETEMPYETGQDGGSALRPSTESGGVASARAESVSFSPEEPTDELAECVRLTELEVVAIRRLATHWHELANDPHAALAMESPAGVLSWSLRFIEDRFLDPHTGDDRLEVLGWLDMPWEDAQAMVIAGMNDHILPSTESGNSLLPNWMCERLGIHDNRRRLARDAYQLALTSACHPNLYLLVGRRDADKAPLMISRLLLQCPDEAMVRRSTAFFDFPRLNRGVETASPESEHFPATQQFPIPQPGSVPVLKKISVTRFRDYLKCPYRFYLGVVMKLETLRDDAQEWSAGQFGDLAHEVLEAFGKHEIRQSEDALEIREFFRDELKRQLRRMTIKQSLPTAMLQAENLQLRLDQFAELQAAHRREGWEIVSVEDSFNHPFDVDGTEFRVSGKIDRVDRHPDGRLAIWDYKTSESGKRPREAHVTGSGDWIDLQLPLYRHMIHPRYPEMDPNQIGLGYVLLVNNTSKIEFAAADWTDQELRAADETAWQVIRQIRQGIYWPPNPPPEYSADWAAICQDNVFEKAL